MKTPTLALVALTLLCPVQAHAQDGWSIEPVKDGLHAILRSGGNVGVRVAPGGVVLIDETYPEDFAEIDELVSRVSDFPVSFVLSAKTTAAEEHARQYGPRQPEFQTAVSLAGIDVQAIYLGQGPTAEDVIVYYFPDLRAVYVGRLLHAAGPFIDYSNGGSSRSWLGSLDGLLALDFDVAIPADGALMERSEIVAFRNQMSAVRVHMTELVRLGLSKSEASTRIRTPELSWTMQKESPFMGSVLGLYDEMATESQR